MGLLVIIFTMGLFVDLIPQLHTHNTLTISSSFSNCIDYTVATTRLLSSDDILKLLSTKYVETADDRLWAEKKWRWAYVPDHPDGMRERREGEGEGGTE